MKINEFYWFSAQVMTKTLFADGIILKVWILVFGLDLLIVNYLKLIDIVRFWSL